LERHERLGHNVFNGNMSGAEKLRKVKEKLSKEMEDTVCEEKDEDVEPCSNKKLKNDYSLYNICNQIGSILLTRQLMKYILNQSFFYRFLLHHFSHQEMNDS